MFRFGRSGYLLGGTTGYAINPARDLGPRIVHSFLPLGKNAASNWRYAPYLGGRAFFPTRPGLRILHQIPVRSRDVDLRSVMLLKIRCPTEMIRVAVPYQNDFHISRVELLLSKPGRS